MPDIQNRKYGVEIEAFNVRREHLVNVLMQAGIPVGLVETCDDCCPCSDSTCECANGSCGCSCHATQASRASFGAWKIVGDGSIHHDLSFELVSPILQGEQGLEQIRKVCRVLNEAQAKVAKTCGLHVHVDARDLNGPTILNVKRRYGALESVIDKFIAPSRRDSINYYCRSVRDNPVSNIIDGDNNIHFMIRDHVNHGRYQKVNLCAYSEHGSIEFRQHHGTVDGNKITNWIKFLVNFVEQSHITNEQSTVRTEITRESLGMLPGFPDITPRVGQGRRSNAEIQQNFLAFYELLYWHKMACRNLYFRDITRCFGWSPTLIVRKIADFQRLAGVTLRISGFRRNKYVNLDYTNNLPTNGTYRLHHDMYLANQTYRFLTLTEQFRETAVTSRCLPPLPENLDWKQGLDPEVVTYLKSRAQRFGFQVE